MAARNVYEQALAEVREAKRWGESPPSLPMLSLEFPAGVVIPAGDPPAIRGPAALPQAPAESRVTTLIAAAPQAAGKPKSAKENAQAPTVKPTSSLVVAARLPVEQIPKSTDGRKALARTLFSDAHKYLEHNRLDEAAATIYRLRELAIDSPRLHQDVQSLLETIDQRRNRQGGSSIYPADLARF
jgi:hypothetical protein